MARYVTYLDLNKIKKIQLYLGNCKYTASQVRKMTGCDYIINGGLYDRRTGRPNCQLKVNGSVLVNDGYGYNSACFDVLGTSFKFDLLPNNYSKYKNGIACVCMKKDGVEDTWAINHAQNDASIGYSATRTVIGLKNGQLAIALITEGMRPWTLYNYLSGQLGWSDILMLDGGGSTQGYLGSGKQVASTRKVHNYICIYMNDSSSTTTDDTVTEETFDPAKNPYPVPTRAIQQGMTGNDVKWVQYQLNCHESPCNVDGSCGPATVLAIKDFQSDHKLEVDGSCGPATRECLKKAHPTECMGGNTVSSNPYPTPTRAIQYYTTGNDVKWVQYQLQKAGYYTGDIDGSYGPASLAAVKAFQKANGLAVDGSIGPLTRATLAKI